MSDWITGNRYLSQSEMENNAELLTIQFLKWGWTKNAIAAMLGNMQSESSINPGIWESLQPFEGGYGLVQWTPYTNYSEWAGPGWEDNGPRECERIQWEMAHGEQWIATSDYPMSFLEFATSTADPGYLAQAFLRNYERPKDPNQPWRSTQAEAWFEFIGGIHVIPVWLLYKMAENSVKVV